MGLVIQTTAGRKDLGNIKWRYPRFFTALRSVLNDIMVFTHP